MCNLATPKISLVLLLGMHSEFHVYKLFYFILILFTECLLGARQGGDLYK